MFDVTVVVNAHREGLLVHTCVRSVAAAIEAAEAVGVTCELSVVLDNPDETTRDFVRGHRLLTQARIMETNFGDLAAARNLGAETARGRFVAYVDADDLWCRDWLAKAHAAAIAFDRPAIWHPERNLIFGAVDPYYFVHMDMEDPEFDIDWLRIENYWTALSFGLRSIYLDHPYHPNRIDEGFGYEDWGWNIRTIAVGLIHKTVPSTMHFIRRKSSGSLLELTRKSDALPDWRALFGPERDTISTAPVR